MDASLLAIGAPPGNVVALGIAAMVVLALLGTALLVARASRARTLEAALQAARAGEIEARMGTRSILYTTLWLFGVTFIIVAAAFAGVIWWVMRRGADAPVEPARQ